MNIIFELIFIEVNHLVYLLLLLDWLWFLFVEWGQIHIIKYILMGFVIGLKIDDWSNFYEDIMIIFLKLIRWCGQFTLITRPLMINCNIRDSS